jgi:cellulose synthase (UDP-forming)
MKIANLLLVAAVFLAPVPIVLATLGDARFVWLNYGIWLSAVVSFVLFLNYYLLYRRGRRIDLPLLAETPKGRVAVFVPTFNEDPQMVVDTLRSIKAALKDRGDIYLLDDSTKPEIVGALKTLCEQMGVKYVHREDRRGFKAGALNYGLSLIGDRYEFLAIFDADQRPLNGFFEEALAHFRDPRVAFVQIPPLYSDTRSEVAKAARYQQEPFLRNIMRGRTFRSAFFLGSGAVFRVKVLKEVGGFVENVITEDVATSIKIHERGYTSLYVDAPLIWHGEAPLDVVAYRIQQNRWSFGYFQSLGMILKSKLSLAQFFDYFTGFLYWFKKGPLTLFELLGPVVYLMLGAAFIVIDPLIYALAYGPYMLASIAIFISTVKHAEYGVKGFLYHQAVEYLAFPAIFSAFLAWLLQRKKPFRVTPKKTRKRNIKPLLLHFLILAILTLSAAMGIYKYLYFEMDPREAGATIVNIFWALYQAFFIAVGIAMALAPIQEEEPLIAGSQPLL